MTLDASSGRVAELAPLIGSVSVFAGLSDQQLEWVAGLVDEVHAPAGTVLAEEGAPADGLYVVLAGSIEWSRRTGSRDAHAFTLHTGDVFAELLLLLDIPYLSTGRALTPVRLLRLAPAAFWQVMAAYPSVMRAVVRVAAERSQIHDSVSMQQAKLTGLGALAAGLAHELNNPAAAICRGAGGLATGRPALTSRALRVGHLLNGDQLDAVELLLEQVAQRPAVATPGSTLDRADREEELGAALEGLGVGAAWELAAALVEAGVDEAWLAEVAEVVPVRARPEVLGWLAGELGARQTLEEVSQASTRVSRLVDAVKEYNYLDQAPEQYVDLVAGVESTLRVLGDRLGPGVEVAREYESDLPAVLARGQELNQVWTQLVENAVDAMGGLGRLLVRAGREPARVVVEIVDDGPGIDPAVLGRIFEPFFTTKGVGRGTGLGLDVARRVVDSHGGDIRVTSRPGATSFTVRLPAG